MFKNEHGSVLVLTMTFALAFTLLGFGSLHYAFMQNEVSGKEKASAEAFWMADGAIEREYKDLLATNFNTEPYSVVPKDDAPDGYLGDYNYYSYVESCPPTCAFADMVGGVCPCVSWVVKSYGTVNDQSRAIYAKVGQSFGGYDIENAIETRGTINDLPKPEDKTLPCEKNMNMHIFGGCVEQSDFTFEEVFDMTTAEKDAFLAAPDYFWDDPQNSGDIPTIGGLTVVDVVSNCTLNIDTANQIQKIDDAGDPVFDQNGFPVAEGSFLVIDTSACSGGNVSVSLNGSVVFRGILWIIGEGKIMGTADIYGAIFIDGALDGSDDTDVGGDTELYYDPTAISEAIDGTSLGGGEEGGGSSGLVFTTWKEIGRDEYDAI